MTRLLFSTGSLYLYDTSLSFAMAARAGFDGIEIMCDERFTTRDPSYLRELAEQHGQPIVVAHTPFSPRIPGWGNGADQLERIQRTLKLAEALGCESIVVHLPMRLWVGTINFGFGGRGFRFPIPSPFASVKTWIERELPAVQRDTPVKIAIENMPFHAIPWNGQDACWWNTLAEWSRVHDHLTLDTTHCATKGIDPVDAYHAADGRVAHIHLSNYQYRQEHCLPHKGELDLGAFLRALTADNYSGTISLELRPDALNFSDRASAERLLNESVAFCREHLTQAQGVTDA